MKSQIWEQSMEECFNTTIDIKHEKEKKKKNQHKTKNRNHDRSKLIPSSWKRPTESGTLGRGT